MNPDGSTATPDALKVEAPTTNPNDLEFELTPEQEQDFVEQILSEGDYTPKQEDTKAPEENPEDKTPEPDAPEPEKPAAPEPNTEPAKEPEKPVDTLSEPQTDDLWIEVERVIVDDLGDEKTETIRLIYDPNDPSSFIPDDFQAKSTKQLAEIMEAKQEMAKLYQGRQEEYEKGLNDQKSQDFEKELLAGWDAEIAELVKVGLLEAPKLKPGEEGFESDPANLKTDAVFKFMTDTNAERAKGGMAPIRSFSLALSMFEKEAAEAEAAEQQKKADEETKKKGGMVGGGSAMSGGTAEQAAYVAGSHGNIWDVPVE